MKTTVSRLKISDYDAQAITFSPESEVIAGAVLLHGQGDFTERYHNVADIFTRYGVEIIGIDLPGHGETSGTKGDVPSLLVIEQFIDTAYHELQKRNPALPIGILGHSVGALLGLHELLIKKRDYQFAWFNGPFLNPEARKSPLQVSALKILGKVTPKLTISTGVKRLHCRKPVGTNIDPLFHNRISLRWGLELIKIAKLVQEKAKSTALDHPILITQGESDTISLTDHNNSFFRALDWPNLQYHCIPDSLHETFLDTPAAFSEITEQWCERFLLDLH